MRYVKQRQKQKIEIVKNRKKIANKINFMKSKKIDFFFQKKKFSEINTECIYGFQFKHCIFVHIERINMQIR